MEPVAPDARGPSTSAGSGRSARASASSRWKAVSKQATCGTPGTASPIASISAISPGRCSGSSGAIRRSSSSISAVTSAGSTNRSPPWTTRCPTAAIAASPGSRPTRSITSPAAAAWSGASTAPRSRLLPTHGPIARKVAVCPIVLAIHREKSSSEVPAPLPPARFTSCSGLACPPGPHNVEPRSFGRRIRWSSGRSPGRVTGPRWSRRTPLAPSFVAARLELPAVELVRGQSGFQCVPDAPSGLASSVGRDITPSTRCAAGEPLAGPPGAAAVTGEGKAVAGMNPDGASSRTGGRPSPTRMARHEQSGSKLFRPAYPVNGVMPTASRVSQPRGYAFGLSSAFPPPRSPSGAR